MTRTRKYYKRGLWGKPKKNYIPKAGAKKVYISYSFFVFVAKRFLIGEQKNDIDENELQYICFVKTLSKK